MCGAGKAVRVCVGAVGRAFTWKVPTSPCRRSLAWVLGETSVRQRETGPRATTCTMLLLLWPVRLCCGVRLLAAQRLLSRTVASSR